MKNGSAETVLKTLYTHVFCAPCKKHIKWTYKSKVASDDVS